jgi:hypothetical protein
MFPRRSVLEVVLQGYFYRRAVASYNDYLSEAIGDKNVWRPKHHSYAGAFRHRQMLVSEDRLKTIARQWHPNTAKEYDEALARADLPLRINASDCTPNACLPFVLAHCADLVVNEKHIRFDVRVYGDDEHNRAAAKGLEDVVDGVLTYPYTQTQRADCLANCLRLLSTAAKTHEAMVELVEMLIPDAVSVRFSPWFGASSIAFVSRARLDEAVDDRAFLQLRSFFLRKMKSRCDLLWFCVDPLVAFTFDRLVALFADQILPTRFALNLMRSFESPGVLLDLVSDPLELQYMAPDWYMLLSEFALEVDVDRLIVLYCGMDDQDVMEDVALAGREVLESRRPFHLRLSGFAEDVSILTDPEARKLLSAFMKYGGMSVLAMST